MAEVGRPRKPAHRVQHGTRAGVAWHHRYEGKVSHCSACNAAEKKYRQDLRDRRKRQYKRIRYILHEGWSQSGADDLKQYELQTLMKAINILARKDPTILEDLDLDFS